MVSELLKQVMQKCNLKQTDLAEVLNVSLSRVKSMTSGRVKNLTREESELLIGKLNIRAGWLISGSGPMFQGGEETEDEFSERHQRIRRMIELVKAMPLREFTQIRLCALMKGDVAQDGVYIANAIRSEALGLDFVTGKPIDEAAPLAALSPRTAALLDNYEHASEEGKRIIEGTASLAAQPKAAKGGQ